MRRLSVIIVSLVWGMPCLVAISDAEDAPDSTALEDSIKAATEQLPDTAPSSIPERKTIPTVISFRETGERFKGKGTDMTFPTQVLIHESGVTLNALGSGVRKKFVFKVYEGVAYVQEGAELGDDPFQGIIAGDFAKRIHMFFERDVDMEKIQGAYRDGMKKVLGEEGWPESVAEDFETFLGYLSGEGIKDQESLSLTWVPGWGLYTDVKGQGYPPLDNPELAGALWAIWFGDKPVSKDLKKDMLRFVLDEDRD